MKKMIVGFIAMAVSLSSMAYTETSTLQITKVEAAPGEIVSVKFYTSQGTTGTLNCATQPYHLTIGDNKYFRPYVINLENQENCKSLAMTIVTEKKNTVNITVELDVLESKIINIDTKL